MKIEIGGSLCYSYLRHVKGCWLVQTNWKSSEHWERRKTAAELESMFHHMRLRFDMGGSVFKQTASVGQFMQQAEIDVVGIDQNGGIHAMDVAFHEAGLNYGGGAANRVLKKMLRAYVLLTACHPSQTAFHIYFVSPKVHKAVQAPLENIFAALGEEYPEANWHLMTNERCHEEIVRQTLDKAVSVADTAELFVRAAKLLNLSAPGHAAANTSPVSQPSRSRGAPISQGTSRRDAAPPPRDTEAAAQLQDVVRGLMKTLFDDCPSLLDEGDIRDLTDSQYCKNVLSLKIGNYPLLRERQEGRQINGYDRYWRDVYGGRFYVCSQWWKKDHAHNAHGMLKLLDRLERSKANHPDIGQLERHRSLLRDFVASG